MPTLKPKLHGFGRLTVTSLPSANLKGHQGWYYNMGHDAY